MATASSVGEKKKHIMMSYAWTGTQDLVYEVAEQLKNEQIPIWMDIRNGLGGNVNDGMARAVEGSAAVCFFMTPEYQDSKNCKRELEYADKLEIPLIACRCRADFKPSKWLGLISAGLMWYDFRDLSDKPVNATMNKLVNYIQTNILKIAPTVFPDLDGRTMPVIFRNRHQFRGAPDIPETTSTTTGSDSEITPIDSESAAPSSIDIINTGMNAATIQDEISRVSDIPSSSKHDVNRFTSLEDHDNLKLMLLPLEGYENHPLVSLAEAVQPLVHLLGDDINRYVYIAKQNSREPKDGLTCDESASIHLYSLQWTQVDDSLFVHLNRALRAVNREGLVPWFSYLKLFLTALFKLPSIHGFIWRGVRGDLSSQYELDQSVIWWGVSSCTASVSVMEQFLGKNGQRTLFTIEAMGARNIRQHSYYKDEDEIVLLPGTWLRVIGKLNPAEDLIIIQLKETTPLYPLLTHPFDIVNQQEDTLACPKRPSEHQNQSTEIESKSPPKKPISTHHQNQSKNKLKALPKKK